MQAAQHREIEAKFGVVPDLHPTLFLPQNPLDGYNFKSFGIHLHTDTYLDTPAYDLLRHGLALRVRQHGQSSEVGIKSILASQNGATQDRLDIAIPLPPTAEPFDTETWPDTITEPLAKCHIKLQSLHALVVVRQRRQKSHIHLGSNGSPLAEWSLDEVWVYAKATPSSGSEDGAPDADNPCLAHFHELEIEQLSSSQPDKGETQGETDVETDVETDAKRGATTGAGDEFATLVALVQEQFDLKPLFTSKLLRGLEAVLANTHNHSWAVMPSMELEAAGRLLLHQQLAQILVNEHGVRKSHSVEYVHDMRVAIRRARAAIELCRSAYAPHTLDPYEKSLKRLGRALGNVRDFDVALANLRAFRRNQPEEQHKGIQGIRKELKRRRRHANHDLMALLDSKRHRKFVVELTDFCITPAADDGPSKANPHAIAPTQVRYTLPNAVFATFQAVRAYETAFEQPTLPPLETFHALRIQTKNLRYLLEFIDHLLGYEGTNQLAQLQALQEHLGQLNDAHVEQVRLRQWLNSFEDNLALCEAVETRLAEIAATIDELTHATPQRLAAFVGIENRTKLITALASI